VRRLALIIALLLVPAAPAAASKVSRWDRVLRDHNVHRTSHKLTLRGLDVGRTTVSIRIHARATNPEPLVFPDPLYGATAWRWTGTRWQRIDDAEVRPAVVQELGPGRTVRLRLPHKRGPARVRVLVPVTADHAGRWVDVAR
jgi:hypothetical protein